MSSIDEKRVHGAKIDGTVLFVASDIGLVRVTVAGERVGEIELIDRRAVHDLAISDEQVAVATDEDVFVLAGDSLEATGFGPATAVGFDKEFLAAGPNGTVARREGDEWTELGALEHVRTIDGDLFGTEGGIYRLVGDELRYSGLDDVRDVTLAGGPYAATATGLYRLGNGWMNESMGDFEMVAADTHGRAHAAGGDEFYEYDGKWTRVEGIERAVVGVAYAGGAYAVTVDGTLLVETDDGWREHPLGAGDVRAVVARANRNPI